MELFIQWFALSSFVLLYCWVGWLAIRKKIVPLKIAEWSIVIAFLVKIVDYAVRVWWSVRIAYPDSNPGLGVLFRRAVLFQSAEAAYTRMLMLAAIAFGLWLVLFYVVRKTNERFLDHSDVLVLCLGIIVSGWPNFLIYFFLVFGFTVIGALGFLVLSKRNVKESRFPITPYFVLAGITVILWGSDIAQLTGIYAIR